MVITEQLSMVSSGMEFPRRFDYLSGVSAPGPRLFDRALVRRRLARARGEQAEFLAAAVADETAHRMNVVSRDFAVTLLHGLGHQQTAKKLKSAGRFQTLIAGAAQFDPASHVVFEVEALPFGPQSFDCIISLLTLQSVNDLPGALIQVRRALKPDGLFLACLFGGATLAELRAAWLEAESEHKGGVTPRIAPFADVREMGALLQRAGFALPVTDIDRTTVRYRDAMALMREIKALGLSNALADRSRWPVTPALLAKAAAAYAQRYSDPDGRVRATVETIWLTAWAPHPSQQQPLRPGSAKARLADALRTTETSLPRDEEIKANR
jgi:SAM-dependent methyltransferase